MSKKITASIALATMLSILLIPLAHGQEKMGIGASKNIERASGTQFAFELDPGETIEDCFVLSNLKEELQSVKVDGVDSVITDSGNFALEKADDEKNHIGAWFHTEETILDVPAETNIESCFSITVPENASPGDYVGGILIQPAVIESTGIAASGTVSVVNIGKRLYVTVTGEEVWDFAIQSIKHSKNEEGSHVIDIYTENNGNVNVGLDAKLTTKNLFVFTIGEQENSLSQITPGDTNIQSIKLDKVPVAGLLSTKIDFEYYRAKIIGDIDPSTIKTESKSVTFIILPIVETIVSILAFLIAFAFLYIKEAKMKKLLAEGKKYTAKKNENLMDIALSKGVDWKLLSKMNKIKPPYFVMKGTTIIIPNVKVK